MNNTYDREEPKTSDDMVRAGYHRSEDGFWIPNNDEILTVDADHVIDNTKLLLLLSSEQLIAQVEESIDGKTVTIVDPRMVRLEETVSDGNSVTSSVSFSEWMPLSKDRRFTLPSSYVVSITNPLDTLVETYLGEFVDG